MLQREGKGPQLTRRAMGAGSFVSSTWMPTALDPSWTSLRPPAWCPGATQSTDDLAERVAIAASRQAPERAIGSPPFADAWARRGLLREATAARLRAALPARPAAPTPQSAMRRRIRIASCGAAGYAGPSDETETVGLGWAPPCSPGRPTRMGLITPRTAWVALPSVQRSRQRVLEAHALQDDVHSIDPPHPRPNARERGAGEGEEVAVFVDLVTLVRADSDCEDAPVDEELQLRGFGASVVVGVRPYPEVGVRPYPEVPERLRRITGVLGVGEW